MIEERLLYRFDRTDGITFMRDGSWRKTIISLLRQFLFWSKEEQASSAGPREANVLVVGDDVSWYQFVKASLEVQGVIDQATMQRFWDELSGREYALIIVDAEGLVESDIAGIIRNIRKLQPKSNIVLTSASPTWTAAREAFHAGALDFIPKLEDSHIVTYLRTYLQSWIEREKLK